MRLQLLILAAGVVVVGTVGGLGCAGNSDSPGDAPTAAQESHSPASSASTTSNSNPPARPAFEAGFDDAGNVDPTPDGGGDTCIDKDDPGSTEAAAKTLPATSDAQNTPIAVKGVISSPVDVDFYKLAVADTSLHVLTADLQDATPSTEMCVFLRCVTGALNFKGCADGVAKTSDIGDKGCCTSGPGKANPTWSCGGFTQFDDSAELYFRIKETGANACLPYSFSYAF